MHSQLIDIIDMPHFLIEKRASYTRTVIPAVIPLWDLMHVGDVWEEDHSRNSVNTACCTTVDMFFSGTSAFSSQISVINLAQMSHETY